MPQWGNEDKSAKRRASVQRFVNAKNSGRHARQSMGGPPSVRRFPRRLRDGGYQKIKD